MCQHDTFRDSSVASEGKKADCKQMQGGSLSVHSFHMRRCYVLFEDTCVYVGMVTTASSMAVTGGAGTLHHVLMSCYLSWVVGTVCVCVMLFACLCVCEILHNVNKDKNTVKCELLDQGIKTKAAC